MSKFVLETINDVRGGRESWRVLLAFTLPAFALAFGTALFRLVH